MRSSGARSTAFRLPSTARLRQLQDVLRQETVGGALLLVAAVVAVAWANSPYADTYFAIRDTRFGPQSLDLHLSVGAWAADGLLAVFFFVVGLELKGEFVDGDLRHRDRAVLPVVAAVGGVAVPTVLYLLINAASGGPLAGWAVPTATDIAFALAVLAVIGRSLPSALRTFLLTLAVVDDLIAITIIAVGYTSSLHLWPLLGAAVGVALFAVAWRSPVPVLVGALPVGLATWGLVHASGIHATVAGVALALCVPVTGNHPGDRVTAHVEHRLRPVSAGVAVPLFALFSAGVAVGGLSGLAAAARDPVAIGVVVGLVVGKVVGIFGSTALLVRLTRVELGEGVRWRHLFGMSLVAAIGFTVSLLIAELAFGPGTAHEAHAKVAILAAAVIAVLAAAAVLMPRSRTVR